MWENLTINGFHFDSPSEYAAAKKEFETLEAIRTKMDLDDPIVALKVYTKLLERNNLHSIIGISFLKELREKIIAFSTIDEEELRSIHAPSLVYSDVSLETGDEIALESDNNKSEAASDIEQNIPVEANEEVRLLNRDIAMYRDREKQLLTVADHYKRKNKILAVAAAALAVVIIALFAIALRNGNLSLESAEIAVQNKYSAWQEELDAKEGALRSYETELFEREEAISEREKRVEEKERKLY